MTATDTATEEIWGQVAAVMIERLTEKGLLNDVIACMTPEERATFNAGIAQLIG